MYRRRSSKSGEVSTSAKCSASSTAGGGGSCCRGGAHTVRVRRQLQPRSARKSLPRCTRGDTASRQRVPAICRWDLLVFRGKSEIMDTRTERDRIVVIGVRTPALEAVVDALR